jgi:hypothetical protein
VSSVEGEVDARASHAVGERTRGVVAGVAELLVDVVVCPRSEDERVVRVHRDRGLVLLVLREPRIVARDGHLDVARFLLGERAGDSQDPDTGDGRSEQAEPAPRAAEKAPHANPLPLPLLRRGL